MNFRNGICMSSVARMMDVSCLSSAWGQRELYASYEKQPVEKAFGVTTVLARWSYLSIPSLLMKKKKKPDTCAAVAAHCSSSFLHRLHWGCWGWHDVDFEYQATSTASERPKWGSRAHKQQQHPAQADVEKRVALC